MALEIIGHLDIIELMENYISKHRPPKHLRAKVDLSYKIEGQSVTIFEIRPLWNKPNETIEGHIAKATFIKKTKSWKVFWMRSNLKWDIYTPTPAVSKLSDFIKLVEEDQYHCFWG
ncbi:MAG TPA: DUF3024 domain-containing protein [Cytophaga sp.]|jgi:hypothetical protein|nr:DUF3024 domain-containing protein [Cytophaga sp.]